MGDVRRAAVSVGALLRAVPLLGAGLILCCCAAGSLAVGVLLAVADLFAAPGTRAGVVLASLILAEAVCHALARLLATVADRRLVSVLRRTVIAAVLRPAGTDHYDGPAVAAARQMGIGREPKPGAALPGVTAWWITVVRRAGALALLVPAGWWVPPAVLVGWLVASVRRGWLGTFAVLVFVCHDIAGSATPLVFLLAVLAAAPDPGTTLSRLRELLRSGAGLITATRTLTSTLADAGEPVEPVALVSAHPLRWPGTLADNVFLDAPHDDLPAVLDELVCRLPAGADTVLTVDLRDGVDLDPEDWRRIGLARALVRVARGARVLVVVGDGPDAVRVAELAREVAPGLTVVLGEREL
ncbi:MAG TPA: hypothetical protein VF892_12505 [Pseudonocardiaceae bacterium]